MDTKATHTEKDSYTKDEIYNALTAMDSRSRTDILYHCRSAADEIDKEVKQLQEKGEDSSADLGEMTSASAVLRSLQSIANRAEEDVKALG